MDYFSREVTDYALCAPTLLEQQRIWRDAVNPMRVRLYRAWNQNRYGMITAHLIGWSLLINVDTALIKWKLQSASPSVHILTYQKYFYSQTTRLISPCLIIFKYSVSSDYWIDETPLLDKVYTYPYKRSAHATEGGSLEQTTNCWHWNPIS